MKTYTIPQYGITVTVGDNKVGEITSELKNQLADENDSGHSQTLQRSGEGKARIRIGTPAQYYEGLAHAHALESFILALACEGYDVSEPRFVAALQSSLEAIANNS